MALNFKTLDEQRDELMSRHPGWQFWYIPKVGGTTWCARPEPGLAEDSPEALEKAIAETEADWRQQGVR